MSGMPWFRFYSETNSDLKFTRIARELQLDKPQVIGSWTIILCLASQSPIRGKLYVTTLKRFTIDDVTDALGWDPQITELLINQFIELGMIHIENDALCITNWDKRQYSSDHSNERVRKHREMKRNSNVTSPLLQQSDSVSVSVSDSLSTLILKYEHEIGALTPKIVDELKEAEQEYPEPGWIEAAIDVAARNNKRSWAYAQAVLKRWKIEGFQSQRKNSRNKEEDESWKNEYSAA